MQESINSDLKMYASASFEAILTEVQSSNLNFRLEISPFSAVIHLKKSLLKNHQGESEVPLRLPKFLQLQELLTQNTAFKNKIFHLENTLQSLKDEHDSVFSDNENRVKTLEHELKVIKQIKFEVKDETAIFYKKTEKMKEELILKTEQIQILTEALDSSENTSKKQSKEINHLQAHFEKSF